MPSLPTPGDTTGTWGTVLNTWLGQGGQVYDVVAGYGADPTGVADSTTAIQNAINAAVTAGGGQVFFPDGNYKITSALTVTGDGISLVGALRGSGDLDNGTCLKVGATFSGTAMIKVQQSGTPTRPLTGITIRSLLLDGNSIGTTVDGIYFQAYVSLIQDVEVARCTGNGIHVQGVASPAWNTYNTRITHSYSHDNSLSGIFIDANGDDTQQIAVSSFGNGLDGARISGASDHMIIACHHYGNSGHGINFIGPCSSSMVFSSLSESNHKAGIYFDDTTSGPYGCLVQGCEFFLNGSATANTWDHIMIAPANAHGTNVVVTGCQFQSFATTVRYGVSMGGQAQGCVVEGNVFWAPWGTGPILANGATDSTHYCKVANNFGVNPVGSLTPPSIPASAGAAVTNPFNYDCTVYVAKAATTGPGPVTVGGTSTGVTLGSTIPNYAFRVPAGSSIGLGTYTGTAPTWTWFGD